MTANFLSFMLITFSYILNRKIRKTEHDLFQRENKNSFY